MARWTAAAQASAAARRDAYTAVLFDHEMATCFANDFTRTPDELLDTVLRYPARGGTDFDGALTTAQAAMESHWSTER